MIRFDVHIRTVSGGNVREHPKARARRVKKERDATAQAWKLLVLPHPRPEWLQEATSLRLPRGLKTRDRALAKKVGLDLRVLEPVWKPVVPLVVEMTRVSPARLDNDNLRSALKGIRDQVARELGVDDRDPVVSWPEPSEESSGFVVLAGNVRVGVYAVRIVIRPAA